MAIRELFFNPYTKQPGKFGIRSGTSQKGLQMAHHDDHLHISSDNSDEMKKIMDKAHEMGLTVHENPYATKQGWDKDGVQPVHAAKSYHYQKFGDGTGAATDITGDPKKIFDFIDNYIYKEITPKPASSDSITTDTELQKQSNIPGGDENEGPSTGGESSTSSPNQSLLGSFLKGVVGKIKGLNEMTEPVSTSSKKVGSNNIHTYKPLNDDDVVSPYDGKVSMISQDQTSKKYSINISHSIDGDKYTSIISGLDSVDVSKGDKVSTNSVIGSVNKNNIITWKVIDENGKSVNVNIIDDDSDDSDDDFLNKKKKKNSGSGSYNKHPDVPLPMQTAIKLNPIGMMMRAAKALTNVKESTQEQNVLTEEIQRIKSLMK